MSIELSKKNIESSFKKVLEKLPYREKDIIEKRLGLNGEKLTLQLIGKSFFPNITRERVRQLEITGISKISKYLKLDIFKDIQKKAENLINLHAGLISSDKLINIIIKDSNLDSKINVGILDIIIKSIDGIEKSKHTNQRQSYYYKYNIKNNNIINLIYKEALQILKKKKNVMDKNSLYQLIRINLEPISDLNVIFIDSVLDTYNDIVTGGENLIGLEKWKILNPKTIKDKAVYVLKKEGLPMYYVDIANKISEMNNTSIRISTVHNELIRNNEFILIGRGIYGLKEHGFKGGTILDIIIDILKKNQKPMNSEDLIKEVLKFKKVQATTIYMNIQNKKYIDRVGRNFYQLKEGII